MGRGDFCAPTSLAAIISLDQAAWLRRLEACNVVGLNPSRRSYGKTSFSATRQLPGRGQISAIEGRLGGGEIRIREIAFAAIGHCQLLVGIGDFRVVRERFAQAGYRLIDQSRFIGADEDRKSTRLNSSHSSISYAVFCLKKKKNKPYLSFCVKKKKKELNVSI